MPLNEKLSPQYAASETMSPDDFRDIAGMIIDDGRQHFITRGIQDIEIETDTGCIKVYSYDLKNKARGVELVSITPESDFVSVSSDILDPSMLYCLVASTGSWPEPLGSIRVSLEQVATQGVKKEITSRIARVSTT